ncbi:MAG TPA: PilZ domain-containing protein [Candidatus Angelobacter sp.]
MGTTSTAFSKVVAKLASVAVEESSNAFLQDCFRQFGITVVPVGDNFGEILGSRKFEACVLRLYDPHAEKILHAARNSPSNRRMVIYGIARNTMEALRFSSFGINAVFDEPLERQGVLKVVRATHLLVIHELRRYVRIPVVTETIVDVGGTRNLAAASQEVSAGGMSLRCSSPITSQDMVRLAFTLPGSKPIKVRAQVCWSRPSEGFYGLRFDNTDEARLAVKTWIDLYLELV